MIQYLIWIIVAFIAGSLPFSVWVGRFALDKDIRHYGDANPGATNVMRAGGKGAYVVALLLDFFKGAIPVGLARSVFDPDLFNILALQKSSVPSLLLEMWYGNFLENYNEWGFVLIALAPILGHAFSPILGFRGGKAVAVTGGVWCALTAWEAPMIGGMFLTIFTLAVGANGWAVMGMMVSILFYFVLTPVSWNQLFGFFPPIRPALFPTLVSIWIGNFLILAWKHREDLAVWPSKL